MEKQTKTIKKTGDEVIPKIIATHNNRGISDKLYELILQRGGYLLMGGLEKIKELDKQIQKRKNGKRKSIIKISQTKN